MWRVCLSNRDCFFKTLDEAMKFATNETNEFVTITDGTTEIVGKFGVDEVKDGICPDGIVYSWVKRRLAPIPLEQKAALVFSETSV